MNNNFAHYWDPHSGEADHKIRQRLLSGTGLTALMTGLSFLGSMTPDFVTLTLLASSIQAGLWEKGHQSLWGVRDSDQHLTPHPEYQGIVDRLTAKAGLNTYVDVRLYEGCKRRDLPSVANMPPGYDHQDWNILVRPSFSDQGACQTRMEIGYKLTQHLTKEEMTSFLSHEVGHIMSPPAYMNPATFFKQSFLPCMIAGGFIHMSLWITLGMLGTYGHHHASVLKSARSGENSADRNGIGLFPHRSAFLDGLEMIKTYQEFLMGACQPPARVMSRLTRIFADAHGDGDILARQVRTITHLDEAQRFYKEHRIDNDLEQILPGSGINRHHIIHEPAIDQDRPGHEITRLSTTIGSWRKAALKKDLQTEIENAQAYRHAVAKTAPQHMPF